ncbi:MAG: nuclear transport factor 2 family protein [Actinomycetota bacterium]|nr:nuclear transport factor 2 family protein [Actinomycetota bacterium]
MLDGDSRWLSSVRRSGNQEATITDPRTDLDAVRQANAAFYAAFEERDLDAMSRVWEHTDRVVCTHPGWSSLRGWARVSASFFALFQNSQRLQFILTNEVAVAAGDTAWVSIDENILDVDGATTVAALNLFTRHPDGRWLMVVHHGSAVTASTEVTGGEDDEGDEA